MTNAILEGAQVRLHARALDQRLRRGEHPRHDRLLTRRGAQLVAPHHRATLAAGLERLIGAAHDEDLEGLSSIVRPEGDEVVAAEPELLALATRLRDGEPVSPAGVVLVHDLMLTAEDHDLRTRAAHALEVLDHGVG